jgi:hypothetical protein
MGLHLLGIAAIHFLFFLSTLILGTEFMRSLLDESFQLGVDQEYKRILSHTGETWSIDQFIAYLGQQYMICAIIACIISIAYYFYYQQKAGGLQSRRPVWWIFLLLNLAVALFYSVALFIMPVAEEARYLKWSLTTPFTMWVMLVPYYVSTFLYCSYDALGSYLIKNAFTGNRNS